MNLFANDTLIQGMMHRYYTLIQDEIMEKKELNVLYFWRCQIKQSLVNQYS